MHSKVAHPRTRFSSAVALFATVLALSVGRPTAHAGTEIQAPTQGLIGLLELPEILGTSDPAGPPGQVRARGSDRVSAYARPDAKSPVVALLDVTGLTDPAGKRLCSWPSETPSATLCATLEHDYEAVSLLVYRTSGEGWYEIALDSQGKTRGWVKSSPRATFRSLAVLFPDRLTYLTPSWDRTLAPKAGGVAAPGAPRLALKQKEPAVRVKSTATVRGKLWLEVDILDGVCGASDSPKVLSSGWVPAHSQADGRLVVWFYSRGC